MITKGAVDVLLPRIDKLETKQGVAFISHQQRNHINRVNDELSSKGLRVLALSYKEVRDGEISEEDEKDLTFIGLIAMIDPPREETKQAVEDCIQAGIRPVMITGDHKITAMAIAEQIGILKDPSEAIEGKDIEGLSLIHI